MKWIPWFVLLATFAPVMGANAQRPAALQALEQHRTAVLSGRIEWAVFPDGDEGRALSFVSRYARNGDMIFENRGDLEGWTQFDPQTKQGKSRLPKLYLVGKDATWHYKETDLIVSGWKRDGSASPWDEEIRDSRNVGLFPHSGTVDYSRGLDLMWGFPHDPLTRWEVTQREDLHVVTGFSETGARVTWYINPAKGWNAERVEGEAHGKSWEAICLLEKFGDSWLPEQTHYFEDGQLKEIVAIRSAELNRPNDPARFTLSDLGVETGLAVHYQNAPRNEPGQWTWDGDKIVDHREYMKDVQGGVREPGPLMKAASERGYFDSPYYTEEQRQRSRADYRRAIVKSKLRQHNDLWTRYVRAFIQRYQLNDEQTEAAWKIHRDCSKHAQEIVDRHKARFEELYNRLGEAKDKDSDAPEKVREVEELEKQLAKLREPIDAIFERQLKPRLEKIPTRAQREAAEQASTPATTQAEPTEPRRP